MRRCTHKDEWEEERSSNSIEMVQWKIAVNVNYHKITVDSKDYREL